MQYYAMNVYSIHAAKEESSDTNDHIHASKHSRNIVIQVTPPAGHDDPQQRNLSAVTLDNHASTSGESAKDRAVKGGLLLSSEAGVNGEGESELEWSGLEISVSELAAAGVRSRRKEREREREREILTHLQMRGKLNYDLWRWIVGYTVDDMRIDHSYPNHPDVSHMTVNCPDVSHMTVNCPDVSHMTVNCPDVSHMTVNCPDVSHMTVNCPDVSHMIAIHKIESTTADRSIYHTLHIDQRN